MAAITPSTNLKLLKNPNNLSNENQLTFSNATAQYNYFNSLTKLEVEDFTYQRKDYVIRYDACIDDILDYNYCMYQNEAYSDKWFYAYIQNMRWVNDHVTEITIKTDVFQTFQFELTYKASFIEREHVNDDTLGAHIIPEGLETGEYIINEHTSESYNTDTTVIMGTTIDPNDKVYFGGASYTGIPSALRYYRYDNIGSGLSPATNTLMYAVKQLQDGYGDSINTIFVAPKWLCGGTTTNIPVAPSDNPETRTINIGRINSLDGYTPKNNKLKTFPYCYIMVSNAQGQANTYRQEVWTSGTNGMVLKMDGVLTPSCSVRIYPQNYNGTINNYDEGLTLGKFPQLNWYTDLYTNWLTQNGVSIGAVKLNAEQKGIIGGSLMGLLGASQLVGGNPYGIGTATEGLSQVIGTMQESYRHSLIPPVINGSLNAGDVISATGINCFHFYKMSVKQEIARSIDSYFSMYGYKVNIVKVPNITGRANWNYVKTIGANIEGLIPEFYLNEIKGLFNAGITLWHNPSTFLDYSQNNNITA